MQLIQKLTGSSKQHFLVHPAIEGLFDEFGATIYSLVFQACKHDHEKCDNLMCSIFSVYNKSLHASFPTEERSLMRLLRIAIKTGAQHNVLIEPVIREIIKGKSRPDNKT